jgi:hypothetical protein
MDLVTGDAPQPGETPRSEVNPWSFDPNGAWWRTDRDGERDSETGEALADAGGRARSPRRRPSPVEPRPAPASPQLPPGYDGEASPFLGEAVDAHAAGVHDAAEAFTEAGPRLPWEPPPAVLVEEEQAGRIEDVEATAAAQAVADSRAEYLDVPVLAPELPDALELDLIDLGDVTPESIALGRAEVEQDHDHKERWRYTFPEEDDRPERSEADDLPEQREEAEAAAWIEELRQEPPAWEPDGLDEADDLPDLIGRRGVSEPEPDRNRPTVSLDRGAVPGQSSGVSRLGQVRPHDSGPRIEASRLRMENSPFWLSEDERAAAAAAWPEPDVRAKLANAPGPADGRRGLPPLQEARTPRRPAAGLLGLVALSLIAAFFSWVSAEPFWLDVGHGDHGLATVTQCTGSGVTQRCMGSFAATDGSFGIPMVPLLGVDPAHRAAGTVATARMVSPQSRQAYVGATGALVHLRWMLGFILVLLCGFGITALTGTRQLESLRARRTGLLLSLAGPALLLTGFLYATY